MGEKTRRLISVVVPCYNEEANVETLYQRVEQVFSTSLPEFDWELVITDNRSTDRTFDIITDLADRDQRVRGYRFARNFGYQRSILAGLLMARGDAVVQLDADLQDPPELIPDMVERWASGARVVYGIRVERPGESRMLTGARKVFYRLIDALAEDELPHDAGDFRLMDRRVVEVLRNTHDADPYLRGSIAAMGFQQVGVEYSRDPRLHGESKFKFRQLFRLAFDGILNHSTRPLAMATAVALVVFVASLLGILGYTVARLVFDADWPAGFATIVLIQLFGIALNALFVGILGSYVGRIFRQVKTGPLVIVDRSAGADPSFAIVSQGTMQQVEVQSRSWSDIVAEEEPHAES